MDTKNFSSLLIKVAGIVIIIASINSIPYYIPYYQILNLPIFMGTVIVPISLPLLIGIFMFSRPGIITNKVVIEKENDIKLSEKETFLNFEQISLSVLGFYLLFHSASDLVFHVATFAQAKHNISSKGRCPPIH